MIRALFARVTSAGGMNPGLARNALGVTAVTSWYVGASPIVAADDGMGSGMDIAAKLSASVAVAPDVSLSSGNGNSSTLIILTGGSTSAGAPAGFGRASHRNATPKNAAAVAAATGPSDARKISDRTSPLGAAVMFSPLRFDAVIADENVADEN